MSKVFSFDLKEGTLNVKVDVQECKVINYETLENGVYPIIKMQFLLLNKDFRLLRSGDLSSLLPDDDLSNQIKLLWKYNNNYTFGTKRQTEILKEHNISFVDFREYPKAKKVLEDNNCLVDNSFNYGKQFLYMPIPNEIMNIIKELLD